jgi:outer membrane protein TolC
MIIFISFVLMISIALGQGEKLSLDNCINIALKSNPNIKINTNLNESADEDVTGSYANILPSVNLNANTGRGETGPRIVEDNVPVGVDSSTLPWRTIYERQQLRQSAYVSTSNDLQLTISQNIFDGGYWWNAIGKAKSDKQSSDYNLASVKNSIVSNVQERFFNLLKQQKLIEVNELAVQRSEDQYNKTQKMFELGSVAKVDVYRSRVNLGNDKIALLQQKNSLVTAKHELNLIMGREPNTPLFIETELNLKPAYNNIDELTQATFQNNPNLMKSKQDVYSSELSVSLAKSAYYPRIGASFRYTRFNEDFDRTFYNEYDKNWSISYGIGLSFNLFNGFNDKVNVQKSKLALRNAQETYEDNRRILNASIVQLAENYNNYLEIINLNEENLEAAKEEYRLAEERYRIGSGTALEVREAQVNLTRAEQTLVAAQYNARIVQAQIEEQIGTIYQN